MRGTGAKRPFLSIYAAAVLSLVYLLLPRFLPSPAPAGRAEMIEASRLAARAAAALRDCRGRSGLPVNPETDPNGTGLIGLEQTEITTSAGRLEAKRTTTNPDFAALIVSLLGEAGVRRGDIIAVGASSSFPALIVATLSAAKVLGLEPLIISSLGASQWGANAAAFSWIDMERCLRAARVLDFRPIARSVGGEEDVGGDISPEGRALLASQVREDGVPFLEEPDLERNVASRMALYRKSAAGRPVKAFVNIGGSWANIGTDAEVLKLAPGLARDVFIPSASARGVVQAMAAEKVPIIHLLNVKGLCERYGLPWDPQPLPEPGRSTLFGRAGPASRPSPVLTAAYILAMVLLMALGRRGSSFSR